MNQARTTYQSDFVPFDWLQKNVISDKDEFCSPDNVDECLKYISQEFSALGFPSIYSNSSDCPFAVNCDIVKFLNVTYELLKSNNEYIQKNEDLETRNQCFCSDLNSLNKKNSILKVTLEQIERKLAFSLERERQLKEKNEQVLQQLKLEKEENKKNSYQVRQQKVAYQHEIRKYENNMNLMKAKINQLLSDKTPNKKIATISSSQALPRNSGQRGKWKTGVTASTAMEEMYNSVISVYEKRTKELCTELNSFRQCLQSVVLEMVDVVSMLQDEKDNNTTSSIAEEFSLNEIKKNCSDINGFEVKFKYLFHILKKTAIEDFLMVKKNLEDQITNLKFKLSENEKPLLESDDSQQIIRTTNVNTPIGKEENIKVLSEESFKLEKMKIEAEKQELSKTLKDIEKEKAEIAAQKVALLRLAIHQRVPSTSSSWHESINIFPAISVITSRSGSQSISNLNVHKSSVSTPEQIGLSDRSFPSPWMISDEIVNSTFCRKSDTTLPKESLSACHSTSGSPMLQELEFSDADLPSWAANKSEIQENCTEDSLNITVEVAHNVSSNEELPTEPSSEEISLLRLKAAVEDIERKRANTP